MAKDGLKPVRNSDEAKRRGRNGGIASGEARRKRKKMREDFEILLSMPAEGQEGMNEQMVMLASLLRKAQSGDVSAAVFIRDTIGEKPNDKVNKNLTGGLTISWQD